MSFEISSLPKFSSRQESIQGKNGKAQKGTAASAKTRIMPAAYMSSSESEPYEEEVQTETETETETANDDGGEARRAWSLAAAGRWRAGSAGRGRAGSVQRCVLSGT